MPKRRPLAAASSAPFFDELATADWADELGDRRECWLAELWAR